MSKNSDIQEEVTQRIIAELEKGVAPWVKPWAVSHGSGKGPINLISNKAYKGINIMLLGMAGYESPYWCTYKQAMSRGGYVKKGEKGSTIVFWQMGNKKKGADEENDEDTKASGKYFYLNTYTVFNVAQCEGLKDVPEIEKPVVSTLTKIESAEQVINNMPDAPELRTNGTSAYFAPMLDTVVVPALDYYTVADEYYSSIFHEFGHSTGVEKRLDRFKGEKADFDMHSEKYAREELIAELVSCFSLNELGMKSETTFRNSASYLGGWIQKLKEDPAMLMSAMSKASEATDWIFDRYDVKGA